MSRREKIEEMLKTDPTDSFLLYSLAMEDMREESFDAAVAGFEKALAADEKHVASYFQMGQTLARMGEEEKAKAIIEQGIEVAKLVGDDHAAAEMVGFLDTIS